MSKVKLSELPSGQSIKASTGTITITAGEVTVDNININGNTISTTSGNVNITPVAGSAVVLDGTINIDAGVVTGATSITSTAFVGNLTGNATSITVADTTDTTCSVALFESATGDLAPKTDAGLTYNAATGTLTATIYAGGAASTTQAGISELATVAETSAGTDTARTVTPDGLGGSIYGTKVIEIVVFAPSLSWTTGDGKAYFVIPTSLNGMNLVTVKAKAITAGTTNASTIQLRNVTDAVDALSSKLSIASGATQDDGTAVINTATDDVATDDLWAVDIDSVSTTPPKGLIVTTEYRIP